LNALLLSSGSTKPNEAKRNTISQRFDDVYNGLPQDVRDAANPLSIAREFDETEPANRTPNAGAGGTRFFEEEKSRGCCTIL